MGLVGWWPLNGNTNDISGFSRNGTASNLTYAAGKIGQAGNFSNSTITIGTGNTFFPAATFTLSAWIKTPGLGAGMSINGILSITYGVTMYLNGSGNLNFRMDNGTSVPAISFAQNLQDDQWHHVTVLFDGTSQKMFIDGELKKTSAFPGWLGITRWMTNAAVIGQENNNGSVYRFNGLINDVRIYDHALSDKEIYELSKAKVLHYTFDDFQEPTKNLYVVSETARTLAIVDANGTLSYGTAATINRQYAERIIKSAATPSTHASYRKCITSIAGGTYTVSWKLRLLSGSISTVGLHFGGGTSSKAPKSESGGEYTFEHTGVIAGTTL